MQSPDVSQLSLPSLLNVPRLCLSRTPVSPSPSFYEHLLQCFTFMTYSSTSVWRNLHSLKLVFLHVCAMESRKSTWKHHFWATTSQATATKKKSAGVEFNKTHQSKTETVKPRPFLLFAYFKVFNTILNTKGSHFHFYYMSPKSPHTPPVFPTVLSQQLPPAKHQLQLPGTLCSCQFLMNVLSFDSFQLMVV